jgi:hypothetical protein
VQASVKPAPAQQLVVLATLDNFAVLQHENDIRRTDGCSPDNSVTPLRHADDEFVRVGYFGSTDNLGAGRTQFSVGDVSPYGFPEKQGFLQHKADLLA